MKKFTRILICLMLCVFGFGLAACDKRTDEEKNFTYPSINDRIYGNGGLAVRKGNYVYFVNGYKSINSSGVSKGASYNVGSLLLMKLGENGEVVTNENGLLRDDYYITMSNQLCGYEVTDLFIHGEYLYFVTPCLENEKGDKVWAKERVIFNRIKLDKTGKVEEVYASGVKLDNLEYKYYASNGSLNILVWEKNSSYYENNGNNALVRVDAVAKTSSIVANDVLEVEFAKNYSEVFFRTQNENNHYLKQYNVIGNQTSNYNVFDKTFDIVAVEDEKVFVSMAHDNGSSKEVWSSKISTKSGFQMVYAFEGEAVVDVTVDGDVVLVKDNVITLVKSKDETIVITDEGSTTIEIVDFTNGCILFHSTTTENSVLKLVSYSNAIAGNNVEIKTLTTFDVVEEDYSYFDFSEDENMLYFYKLSGDDYYLHRLKVNNNLGETEEMFGVYEAGDEPKVEEEEEEIEE